MCRRIGSRSVHEFGTCKENAAAQCRLPTNFSAKHVFETEVGTAQPHSLTEFMHRLRSDSPAHFDIKNTHRILMEK